MAKGSTVTLDSYWKHIETDATGNTNNPKHIHTTNNQKDPDSLLYYAGYAGYAGTISISTNMP
jgi:hypothetical protein